MNSEPVNAYNLLLSGKAMMKCKTILLVGLLTFAQSMSAVSAVPSGETQKKPLVIVSKNYMPFFFREGDGVPRGILVDFWNLWSSKSGVPVHFGSWI